MKTIKKVYIFMSLCTAAAQASNPLSRNFNFSGLPYTETARNLELFNKSSKPIIVIAEDGQQRFNMPSARTFSVEPGQKSMQNIQMNKPLKLTITEGTMTAKYNINAIGKTKYLTWNSTKNPSLYPQTGPLNGWRGVTESGMPLKNNLDQGAITKE